jgi:spore germination protein GerM
MTRRLVLQIGIGAVGLGLLAWAVSSGLERLVAPPPQPAPAATPAAVRAEVPHITATIYYGTQDGQALVALRREVPLGEGVRGQGRRIVETLLSKPPVPFVQVVPDGTTLRAFYLTPTGDAFVDVSGQASTALPGGTTAERLAVYSIVDTIATNLPSVKRVQILVDGMEVDTLAGHVDLRHPLEPDLSLLRDARRTSR